MNGKNLCDCLWPDNKSPTHVRTSINHNRDATVHEHNVFFTVLIFVNSGSDDEDRSNGRKEPRKPFINNYLIMVTGKITVMTDKQDCTEPV